MLAELDALVAQELKECPPQWRALYERAGIEPEKWQLPPWGDEGSGFWVVAIHEGRVLWYNDIEEGWNVSTFSRRGLIDGYWCNQDPLELALPQLAGEPGVRLGPPQPIGDL